MAVIADEETRRKETVTLELEDDITQFSQFGQDGVDHVKSEPESVVQKHEENLFKPVHGVMTSLVFVHVNVLLRWYVVHLVEIKID